MAVSSSSSVIVPGVVARRRLDQASGLRAAMSPAPSSRAGIQVIAVSSGKGGVGKSNVVANLAVASARQGRNVMVMDADLALGNVDILLGLTPHYTIEDVLSGQRRLEEVLITGPEGIQILPATSGGQAFTQLTYDNSFFFNPHFFNCLLRLTCSSLIARQEFRPTCCTLVWWRTKPWWWCLPIPPL